MATKIQVTIENKKYNVDVERAIGLGVLTPIRPMQAGDVYKHPSNIINRFLLVRVNYRNDAWMLLGLGCNPNSGEFFESGTRTLAECENYLERNSMVFSHNINAEVSGLVNKNF